MKTVTVADEGFVLLGEMEDPSSEIRELVWKYKGIIADTTSPHAQSLLGNRFNDQEIAALMESFGKWEAAVHHLAQAMELFEDGWCNAFDIHEAARARLRE